MEQALTTIDPIATPLNGIFYGLVLLCIVCAVLSFLLLSKRILSQGRTTGLLGMLSGFIGLVAFCAVIFTWFHAQSIKTIVFNEETLSVSGNDLPYKNIERHYIKPLMQKSRYSAQLNTDTALIYVIEKRDGNSLLLSNEYYNLLELKEKMDMYVK